MKKLLPMRTALEDRDLFGRVLEGESWAAWRVLLIAIVGEPLTDGERTVFRQLTGRDTEPGEPVDEFWGIVGRRGGKSRAIAVLGSYLAALVDVTQHLAPGERASLPIISASLHQANKIHQYVDGVFANVPVLKKLVTGQTSDTISLSTRVDIEVRPASFRTIRGGTMAAILADEVAFWRSDNSANPDTEILNAARPGISSTGGMLAAITSPYAKAGEAYKTFKRYYGPDRDPKVIVARAASRMMNPSLSQSVIDRAYERDAAAAAAEYGGEFRNDVETFISPEAVDGVTVPGRRELPYLSECFYFAFVDPSGGSSDAMTLAISHQEKGVAILDLVREVKPPFSPENVVSEFARTLSAYGLSSVTGDRYGGEWPRERFKVHGIHYELSDLNRSDLYRELLPQINSGKVELLDLPVLRTQLCSLERRTGRSGKDSIDHAPGAHDDLANAVAGALVRWSKARLSLMDVL